jgi:hypothetical protein
MFVLNSQRQYSINWFLVATGPLRLQHRALLHYVVERQLSQPARACHLALRIEVSTSRHSAGSILFLLLAFSRCGGGGGFIVEQTERRVLRMVERE